MNKLLLIYWTGTFNTRFVTEKVKKSFIDDFDQIDTVEINLNSNSTVDLSQYSLIGIGYPIYGFNIPGYFLKHLKKLKWPQSSKIFIYKNSGETLHANDASSYSLVHYLKRKNCVVNNEYHFLMPYNIHFRFEDETVKEILDYDKKLLEILHEEVIKNISNIKKYRTIHKFITFNVGIIHICGLINSFFYKVDKNKCSKCGLCVKQCPMNNIEIVKDGKIKFHHRCETCMRCSFFCPKDAIKIGFLNGWRVNGAYNFKKINEMTLEKPFVNEQTKGFFACYKETYKNINQRHKELFGK